MFHVGGLCEFLQLQRPTSPPEDRRRVPGGVAPAFQGPLTLLFVTHHSQGTPWAPVPTPPFTFDVCSSN